MVNNLMEKIKELEERLETLRAILDLECKVHRLSELEKVTLDPGFWADKERARRILKERKICQNTVNLWTERKRELEDNKVLLSLAHEERDEDVLQEIEKNLVKIALQMDEIEFKRMLSGENDINNAILTLHPGAGGIEAQDWAEMLCRMYLRWAEREGFKTEILDYQPGEEAGVKSVTLTVKGDYAYGYLKSEVGIHRLVRLSPFDTNHRRHTSFASVFVYSDIEEEIVVEIDEKDLRIDTFRASGAGGQHVNKTESAVRITHLLTGIVVQCQNERSQHKNKAMAMKVLRARLYDLQLWEQAQKMEKLHESKKSIGWGSQIRSYILHPYRMVKDHRSGIEVTNVDLVLDGEINQFIETYLKVVSNPS